MTPIIGHPKFEPGFSDPAFSAHSPQKILRASYLLCTNGCILGRTLFTGSGSQFLNEWRVHQLSHFLNSLPKPHLFQRPLSPFGELCLGDGPIRKSLSLSYEALLDLHAQSESPFSSNWEKDLQVTFTNQQKDRILYFTHKSSLCSNYQETTYKIMTRWYRTPSVLAKLFPLLSDRCWRCDSHRGTLLHIFWECPSIHPFWRQVLQLIHKFTDSSVSLQQFFLI